MDSAPHLWPVRLIIIGFWDLKRRSPPDCWLEDPGCMFVSWQRDWETGELYTFEVRVRNEKCLNLTLGSDQITIRFRTLFFGVWKYRHGRQRVGRFWFLARRTHGPGRPLLLHAPRGPLFFQIGCQPGVN